MEQTEQSKQARKRAVFALQSTFMRQAIQLANSQGITQAELCRRLEALGVQMRSVATSQMKAGTYDRQLSLYTLLAVGEVLGVEVKIVLGDASGPGSPLYLSPAQPPQ